MKGCVMMYPNKFYNGMPYPKQRAVGDRFIGGGFLAPFLLGGITGGLLAPAFYPRPIYVPPVYGPYPPYPVYPGAYNQNQYIYYN